MEMEDKPAPSLDRREFLKKSAVVTAGASAAVLPKSAESAETGRKKQYGMLIDVRRCYGMFRSAPHAPGWSTSKKAPTPT
jgi:hypothetical protein